VTEFLETYVEGDATTCLSAAGGVRDAQRALDDAEDGVHNARFRAADLWHGDAGEAFYDNATTTSRHMASVAGKMHAVNVALTDFAGELEVVRSKMADARGIALANGLAVDGSQIRMPASPGADGQDRDALNNRQVAGWNAAVVIVSDARRKESEAHGNLARALGQAMGDGVIEDVLKFLGLLPKDGAPVHMGDWAAGLAGLAYGVGASHMIYTRYGQFQPRAKKGFGTAKGMDFWKRYGAGLDADDNWHAKSYRAPIRGKWQAAGKWGGWAGLGVTAGVAAWDQWEEDSHDPSLGTAERVGRTGTQTLATAGGAGAGAWAGTVIGGAIGTALFPGVGTVVGGAVGGLIGGAAGGWAGEKVGDWGVDLGGTVTDAVSSRVGDAAGSVGDGLSSFGKHLKFW
jgi:hypothetical protein